MAKSILAFEDYVTSLVGGGVSESKSYTDSKVATRLPLSGGTMSGNIMFSQYNSIIQKQDNSSNYTSPIKWYKGGVSQNTYDPQIGQHNTGGDGSGTICILPYATDVDPWGGTVGLFVKKGSANIDGKKIMTVANFSISGTTLNITL